MEWQDSVSSGLQAQRSRKRHEPVRLVVRSTRLKTEGALRQWARAGASHPRRERPRQETLRNNGNSGRALARRRLWSVGNKAQRSQASSACSLSHWLSCCGSGGLALKLLLVLITCQLATCTSAG